MGWKSDWLYQLVFDQFQRAWIKAQRDGEGRFGPASNSLVVTLYNEAIFDSGCQYCRGTAIRSWRFNGHDWAEYDLSTQLAVPVTHGMLYETAIGRFHISDDRRVVTIEFTFGPRYGRGFVFLVHGQGTTAKLIPKPDSSTWSS